MTMEYCCLRGFAPSLGGTREMTTEYPFMVIFGAFGAHQTNFTGGHQREVRAIVEALARLAREDWELVGATSGGSLWFQRRVVGDLDADNEKP